MSDSEDDFMSDKFLVDAPTAPTKTHTQQRAADQLKAQRRGQAKNQPKLVQLEKERRTEGLSRSLFDSASAEASGSASESGAGLSAGGNKAMAMMQKMGWKVGEGLGRQRSSSPPHGQKRGHDEAEEEDEAPRRGIGAARPAQAKQPRIEPIRVSLWAGRKGLSARSPSPPPLPPSSGRNVDHLDPEKLARLGKETDSFREFNRRQFGSKDMQRKAAKARDLLVGFDKETEVKFHPLHVLPFDPLSTLPRPLLILIYPAQALALSPSPPPAAGPERSPSPPPLFASREKPLTAAEKVREQMRRDMLSSLDEGEEDPIMKRKRELGLLDGGEKVEDGQADKGDWKGVMWQDEVSGTKKVLSMDTESYFTFLLSQLRHEHLFCFWCGYKYGSYEEMEGAGGCPGTEEDDH
ncbi:uncharacterized protein MKK02DRAFT_38480 [Dioszegia hungarica]|uniref:G-patch domain-containing protein n=1 Tax=Dioszegia hungarica TaxID=4972 RepID=A0AA38H7Q6_9TREE|nr:uncharacterized protein MKK02DRAFT_38480 [Dioszegia hungarica]KAI9633819.1 hypothetical protein MKK02DRAFT_38480 [Dioszegia hungarica]